MVSLLLSEFGNCMFSTSYMFVYVNCVSVCTNSNDFRSIGRKIGERREYKLMKARF